VIPLSIAIPVGPRKNHRKWLRECVENIKVQLGEDDSILLVYEPPYEASDPHFADDVPVQRQVVKVLIPARIGVAAMVNLSVGYAENEHVLLMNSDDKLLPDALEAVREAWEKHQDRQGWYYLNTLYSDGREQKSASGVAMVCKSHFLKIGGYPPESAVGYPDWMFLSLMQERGLITTYPVSDKYLHWHRVHPEQETLFRQDWNEITKKVHATLQTTWRQPE